MAEAIDHVDADEEDEEDIHLPAQPDTSVRERERARRGRMRAGDRSMAQ